MTQCDIYPNDLLSKQCACGHVAAVHTKTDEGYRCSICDLIAEVRAALGVSE